MNPLREVETVVDGLLGGTSFLYSVELRGLLHDQEADGAPRFTCHPTVIVTVWRQHPETGDTIAAGAVLESTGAEQVKATVGQLVAGVQTALVARSRHIEVTGS